MPTSSFSTIPVIAQLIRAQEPSSVLDVGIGFGKWGYMVRELQDIAYERYQPSEWKVTLVGVEAFEKYRTPIWDYIYDSVIIGDIKDHKELLGKYDLVMFIDVLEHMEHDEGIELLDLVAQAGKQYIASMPAANSPQGAFCGNEFEIHRSVGQWKPSDFGRHTMVTGKIIGWN